MRINGPQWEGFSLHRGLVYAMAEKWGKIDGFAHLDGVDRNQETISLSGHVDFLLNLDKRITCSDI